MIAMCQNEIILRPANPTRDAGKSFAVLLDRSAEGFFRFWFGPNFIDIVATAYIQPGHDLSFQNVTFAEHNGAIVGMALGYTAEQHRLASDHPLKKAAGKARVRMKIISILFAPLMRIIDNIPDGDFYLQAIAVEKGFDGKGVGSMLLDAIDKQAITNGSARLALDVSAKNERARRLYEKRGMAIESQWPKRLPISGLRFYRMVKTL